MEDAGWRESEKMSERDEKWISEKWTLGSRKWMCQHEAYLRWVLRRQGWLVVHRRCVSDCANLSCLRKNVDGSNLFFSLPFFSHHQSPNFSLVFFLCIMKRIIRALVVGSSRLSRLVASHRSRCRRSHLSRRFSALDGERKLGNFFTSKFFLPFSRR